MVNSGKFSAGDGRGSMRWRYSAGKTVGCPWCEKEVLPKLKKTKLVRKKVLLSVLFCPYCEEVWQFRGELPESVECPSCRKTYNPAEGNLPDKGKFICRGTCNGNVDAVIAAIRTLPDDQLLRMQPYGIEGYCKHCAGVIEADQETNQTEIFDGEATGDPEAGESDVIIKGSNPKSDSIASILRKNNGKFLKRVSAADVSAYQKAEGSWGKNKTQLPHPKSEIPYGEKTKSGLLAHHYRYWHQMFNDRQLLALSTLLLAIDEEKDQTLKEMLLSCFEMTAEANNMFTWNISKRSTPGGMSPGGVFRRHDFHPKMRIVEQNVWGTASGRNTFQNRMKILFEAKAYVKDPIENVVDKNGKVKKQVYPGDGIRLPLNLTVLATSSAKLDYADASVDFIVTDPPYAGNVNYAELSDFFHVWLRLILASKYPEFAPEYTPKAEEVIENRTRGKSNADFEKGLTGVFAECFRVLRADGTMTFTFHHADDVAWESLLIALCNAGFVIEAVYPIHGEAENSLHLIGNEAISYDLIHVCRKRESGETAKRPWASVRQEIRRRAREEAREIERGRYGGDDASPKNVLSPADVNILLIGKCLELYSKHYGSVVDHNDESVPLRIALEEIKMFVDQLVAEEQPLPSELEDLLNSDPPDRVSYVYFRALCGNREIKSDDVYKYTRGITEVSELKDAGLLVKGTEQRVRTFEVKQPMERLNEMS